MAGDKRPGSGPPGKSEIAAVSRPSARRPREGKPAPRTPCRSILSFPAFSFEPSAHAPTPPLARPAPAHVRHHALLVPPLFENLRAQRGGVDR